LEGTLEGTLVGTLVGAAAVACAWALYRCYALPASRSGEVGAETAGRFP
jgi:hypothetical protein